MNGNAAGGSGAQLDIRTYWRILKKRKWVILAAIALVTGGFVAWTMHETRLYQAVATVIIDPAAPKVMPSQDVVELGTGNFWDNHEYYNTQMRILKSHRLAREVARKNMRLIRDRRIVGDLAARPTATEDDLIEATADYIEDGLRVLPVRDSRIFGIGFMDKDADLAADLANLVSTEYIAQNRAVKVDETHDATRWVATQLDKARGELDATENALYLYKKNNNILSINLEERQNLIARDLDDFSRAQTEAHKKRIDLQSRRRAILAIMATDAADAPATYVADAPAIAGLRAVYRDEKRKLDGLSGKYGPEWPDVKQQKTRTDAALEDLRTEGKALVRAVDGEISALSENEARYTEQLERLKADALDLNQHEVDYKKLTVAATGAEQSYVALLKRYHESGMQELDTANNIRPLDEAQVPTSPSEPRMKQAVVFGLALGVVLALALAFLVEVLDRTVKSQEDVEAAVGLPFLGIVPSVALHSKGGAQTQTASKSDREHHVIYHPTSAAAECCRVVRTNIMFCSPDKPLKNLLVTSSNPVEGKTMTVVNLGVVMAQGGNRTLIVDTDMRRPRLHKILGASNEHGVSRLIVEHAGDQVRPGAQPTGHFGDLDAAIKSTEVPNLFILPCGPVPPNPAELLQTERFAELVRTLGERFDRILFDSPPVLAVTDAAILSRVVDGAVMVVRAGRTTHDALTRARHLLAAVNANIIGVVLNDVDLKNPHYAEYYGYTSKYYGVAKAR